MIPPLVETTVPGSTDVAFAVYAPFPRPFGEKDRERLAVVVRTLPGGTQEYPRRTIFDITEGRTVQASLLPDGVLLRFIVPRARLSNGVALVEGLLRRPILDDVALEAARTRLARREPNPWTSVLQPLPEAAPKVTVIQARALLERIFDPSRVVVAVAGAVETGEAGRLWARRTADWEASPPPRYPDLSPPPDAKLNPSGPTVVELRGKPFSVVDPRLPARWLALVALGVGKGSSLFRDVRQAEGWSYRQEALLWPAPEGLETRLVAAVASDADESGRADALRSTLRKAVEGWTESDRTRALGIAAAGLEGDLPLGPLWIAGGFVGNDLLDRATLDAYWWSKAGVRWDLSRLLTGMSDVSLDVLKEEATRILDDSRPIVVPGRP